MEKENNKTAELSFQEKALIAFQRAIDKVILEHKRLNLPLHIKRNGKLEAVSADEILRERGTKI